MSGDESIYRSLSPSSIRLLEIMPALPDEQIECALTTVQDVNEAPEFEAISYVWGQDISPDPILCNGSRIRVTQNLEQALRHLRPLPRWESVQTWPSNHPLHSSRHAWRSFARNRYEQQENATAIQTPVWIDAICINQADLVERANQVKLMAYGPMPIVLFFLAQAIRNMEGRSDNLVALRPLQDLEHRNLMYGLPKPLAWEWKVFQKFLSNPWFRRTWVVQEVVLAQRGVVIVLGDWQLDWDAVGKATTWYQAKGYAMPRTMRIAALHGAPASNLLPVADAAALWRMYRSVHGRIPLSTLMKDFRLRSAGQDVDKLYAALSLAEETDGSDRLGLHPLLEPDYKKPVQDVYRDLAAFLIIEHGSLFILSCVDRPPTQNAAWQSWVPDWRQAKITPEIWDSQEQIAFQADGDEPLSVDFWRGDDCLCVEGITVDTIRYYGDRLKGYGFGFETYAQERDFMQAAWKLAKSLLRGENAIDHAAVQKHARVFVSTITASRGDGEVDEVWDSAARWFADHLSFRIPSSGGRRRSADPGRFHEAFVHACIDRRFFITRDGLMGIGPHAMKQDDNVVVLFGGKVPFVVRRVGSQHALIGECYVAGLMRGEAVKRWRNSSPQMRDRFELSAVP
ncbi:hypothetical protein E0Z10_g7837 [Xylaria hypoxylon]|uniref:Heterokaryon incompatibility domain-containing protein n=1 Tax=Xylaria hypoxylon TaxID=37992 RepID=A0A4Z0YP42_9PEZI|nr:hypothetical protein E0Z10_g7837 [Xylaria hypoxylon]